MRIKDLIESIYSDQRLLRGYFLKAEGHIDYFFNLINELRDTCDNPIEKGKLLRQFTEIFNIFTFSVKAELLLLRILYLGGCFNSRFLNRFMDCIYSDSLCAEDRLFLWQDATMMYLEHGEYLYKEFFLQKRELTSEIAQSFKLTNHGRRASEAEAARDSKRIVVTQIMYPDYPPMKVTTPVLRELANKGYELYLIELSAFEYDSGNSLFEPFYRPRVSASEFKNDLGCVPVCEFKTDLGDISARDIRTGFKTDFGNGVGTGIHVYYPNGNTMKERMQDILNRINEINPALIIDISDEYSFISYYYIQDYPVIYWPMKRPSSGAYFDKIVMPRAFYAASSMEIAHPFTAEQCIDVAPAFEKVSPAGCYSRSDFDLSREDFVMITVGNRINVELSNKFIDSICDLLNNTPHLVWFIVGCDAVAYVSDKYRALLGGQLRYIKYEEKLPDLFSICDLYLNPHRIGGGTSIAWACQQGLALATPKGNISGYVFAGDTYAAPSEDDLAPYIIELMSDKNLLNKNKQYMKAKADSFDVASAAGDFKMEIDKLIDEYYSQRQVQSL
ncbi:MAG: hypothetical protein LBL49_02020 [Clostridiales Family XIII bacterium]|jgi:hypothetical protein|nr:hypothetical protein [Clostridiales Family XIII bacterium]